MGEDDAESCTLESLHDFLAELDNEWEEFRRASLVGAFASCLLVAVLGFRFFALVGKIRRSGLIPVIDGSAFHVLSGIFAAYEISILVRQHGFFKKWERRTGLLLHLEGRLIENPEQ